MSNSFIPQFCDICNNLLDIYDMSSLNVRCNKCYRLNSISPHDRVISVMTYSSSSYRSIQPSELMLLSNLPTTQRIKKHCEKCSFDTMIFTTDENYNFNYVCIKCKTVYN